jgi:anti-anti-sigma regulatory factor
MGLQSLLETRSQEQNGVVTIALSGDLDLATAPILSEKLAPFEGNGVSTIILDLQDWPSSTRPGCTPSSRPGTVR